MCLNCIVDADECLLKTFAEGTTSDVKLSYQAEEDADPELVDNIKVKGADVTACMLYSSHISLSLLKC